MFQHWYDSPWHNPGLFFVAQGAFLLLLLFRWTSFRDAYFRYFLLVFTFEIALDAWLTGGLSPFQGRPWLGTLAVPFVIVGDLRYFALATRYARLPRAPLLTLGLSFLVPLVTHIVRLSVPAFFRSERNLFLLYEILFLVLALGFRQVLQKHLALVDASTRKWLAALTRFEIAQYAFWALADAVILLGSDVGFLLRIVPNVMYYALFLPFVYAFAPEEARV